MRQANSVTPSDGETEQFFNVLEKPSSETPTRISFAKLLKNPTETERPAAKSNLSPPKSQYGSLFPRQVDDEVGDPGFALAICEGQRADLLGSPIQTPRWQGAPLGPEG